MKKERHNYKNDQRYRGDNSLIFLEDRNHDLMYKNRKWFVIDWPSGMLRFKKILELYPITDQISYRDVFITFGFKILTPGEKDTFYMLKQLALLNEVKYKKYQCQVSLDYLALVFDTTIYCQSRRIQKLKKTGLLKIEKHGGGSAGQQANIYLPVRWAFPDSTLLSTLIALIRRKKLIELVTIYKKELSNPILESIRKLIKKMPQYEHLLTDNIKKELGL